jgi:toxin-antitoxin system PIN domain toxin
MLVDANILLYAIDEESRQHAAARAWLETALNGPRRVGLPWQSLVAFVRIASHPRALASPLTASEAWGFVDDWLDAPVAWIPQPGPGHRDILRQLVCDMDLRGNLVSDAVLAALCLEYGLAIVSADSDFARFRGLNWINPAAP